MTSRKRITVGRRTVVRRVRSPKHAGSRPSKWGGLSFPRLRWTGMIFGNRRSYRRGL